MVSCRTLSDLNGVLCYATSILIACCDGICIVEANIAKNTSCLFRNSPDHHLDLSSRQTLAFVGLTLQLNGGFYDLSFVCFVEKSKRST